MDRREGRMKGGKSRAEGLQGAAAMEARARQEGRGVR